MLDHLTDYLASDAFMPHGMCFLWRPDVLWLHVASDAVIAIAYYSIPIALLYFVRKRQDLAFPNVFILFGVFILACGTTHVMGIWTIWHPDYWLDGGIKLVTATASILTAALVWRIMPNALALPSRGELESANLALARQIEQRRRAEAAALQLNAELERRVQDRTAELEASNERLRVALHEREVLLREVHHRVKNNLQVIAGLLQLQAYRAGPELMARFRDSLERIGAMGRVHEQLHRADDASTFDLATFIETMCRDLTQVHVGEDGCVACRVEVRHPVRIPFDAATPAALMISEVITNAFKHAFPSGRKGQIMVTLDATEDGRRVEISDDGVGLPPDHAARSGTSMGTRLVETLARQIGATIRFESGAGTRFVMLLPWSRDEQASPHRQPEEQVPA
jgi:two-component sensor histidine kinase